MILKLEVDTFSLQLKPIYLTTKFYDNEIQDINASLCLDRIMPVPMLIIGRP
jgi:hypothetical protein